MGAAIFMTRGKGKTAQEAFDGARDHARHTDGHGGYTGTVAEKTSFVVIPVPAGKNPSTFASDLLDDGDPRVDDKWGPAGCVKLAEDEFLFFGWASS